MSLTPRYLCLQVHRYTGLLIAILLMIAGISGAFLAFQDELDRSFNRQMTYVEINEAAPLSVTVLHNAAIDIYGQNSISSFPISMHSNQMVALNINNMGGSELEKKVKIMFQEVHVPSYTGEIIEVHDKNKWEWSDITWKVFWLRPEIIVRRLVMISLSTVALIWMANYFLVLFITQPEIKIKNSQKSY